MVKSDMLYQINLRLQEIKQNKLEFGGVAVLLFGDLMQLRPVRAKWIFQPPASPSYCLSHAYAPLWDLFSCVVLSKNHRQGEDGVYAALLNRLRYGKQTKADLKLLKSRVKSHYSSDAVHLFGKRIPVKMFNEQKLAEMPTEAVQICSINIHPFKNNYNPPTGDDGTVRETPFMNKLNLKVLARVMLTYNVDTSDGLTNGCTGEVVRFEYDVADQSKVTKVYLKFDDDFRGANLRQRERCSKNETPITRVSFSYSLGKASRGHSTNAKVIQFPLKLAWAATVHKFQGQTIKKPKELVGHMETLFAQGQAYVMLGRIQCIDQLILPCFDERFIYTSDDAHVESLRLESEAINIHKGLWYQPCKYLKIASLNIRSLPLHVHDLMNDKTLLEADILCLNETFLPDGQDSFKLPNENIFDQQFFAGTGRGKGVCMFTKADNAEAHKSYVETHFQMLCLNFKAYDVISVYRSPKQKDVPYFIEKLNSLTDICRPCIIIGDFNDTVEKDIEKCMNSKMGLIQIIDVPTHLDGGVLDKIFVRSPVPSIDHFVHSIYYSDHDAVCAIFDINSN
jgi:hypothetical protein